MKGVFWFVGFIGILIIGITIAILVLVAIDFARDDNQQHNDSPNIGPTLKFSNGKEIPIIGLGSGWTNSERARLSLLDAIDRGYRHIDTAYIYSDTEIGIGQAIQTKIDEGVITREDMFVCSKLWRTFLHPDQVRGAFMTSLNDLNLTYVDLYLIHWPMNVPESTAFGLLDTWRAMEALVDEGLVKSIGVSNFNATQLDYIIDNARIKPVNNQIESNPHCLNRRLIEHCHSRDVVVTAHSPLGNPGHPQHTPASRLAINEPNILTVARRHGRTPAQIMIRYQMQNGNVVIPKSDTRDRVITNFDVFNFHLSELDIHLIESTGYHFRMEFEAPFSGHHQYPFESWECD